MTRVGLAGSKWTRIGGEVSCDFRQCTASEQASVQSQGSSVLNSLRSAAIVLDYCSKNWR